MVLAFSLTPSLSVLSRSSSPSTCRPLPSSSFVPSLHFLSPPLRLLASTSASPPRCSSESKPPATPPPSSSFTKDFFSGPSSPPRPRPVYQVVLFSITTNLLWYGWYKYCIEEEILKQTGHGLGGALVLLPFVLGVSSPLYIPDQTIATVCALSGLGWILVMQYWLVKRVNDMYDQRFGKKSLTPTWAFIPPLNVIVGLRTIHFLALVNGFDGNDPVVDWFPFIGKEELTIKELALNPKLWVSFGGKKE